MFAKFVLDPIIEHLNLHASNNAFCINSQFYSYKDFAVSISKIRQALKGILTIKSPHIGIVANDDLETYASIFAVWLEGLAYVPLHPRHPLERSLEIICQAEISFLLDSTPKTSYNNIVKIDTSSLYFDGLDLHPREVPDEALAYILFTSGSTGKPKGVQITRKNIGSFMKSFWDTGIHIYAGDRCLQCFDLTFDVSVQSFLVPLTKGACIFTIPLHQIKYSYVSGLLEDHQITFGAMAPSMIRYLRPYFNEINIPSMRYSILTAEASPVDLVADWSKCIPNAEIINFYGPTEATIYCTYYEYNPKGYNKHYNGMMPIGKVMEGIKAIIMDKEQEIHSKNQKGELCISGDQLTPGYWKNPEKSRESFFEREYYGQTTRFYKTGDICFFDEDGDIMLTGRLDNQIKIQGYRIELGEIEFLAREYANGSAAVAVTVYKLDGDLEIALAIEDSECDIDGLIKFLKSKLPSYMIPSRIRFITPLPLNYNGKIDRIKLQTYFN